MTGELAALIQSLVEGLGGEAQAKRRFPSCQAGRKNNPAAGAGCHSGLQIAAQIRGWLSHLQMKFAVAWHIENFAGGVNFPLSLTRQQDIPAPR